MRKYLLNITIILLLQSCESVNSKPNPYKSKRSFSNIDKVTYAKRNKKLVSNKSDNWNLAGSKIYSFNEEDEASGAVSQGAIFNNQDQYLGTYKIGNPYEIQGVSYFPQNYDEFEETGTASWYGHDFHGKPTANGEIYDSDTMTAAHPTLPLPSMVRITNLKNGKVVIVRVNDRGPFAKSRVIDVSEKAAEELGFKDKGTAEVRVQLLKNDTDELLQRLKIKN